MLFDDTLRPITDGMGLLRRSARDCAEALLAWRSATPPDGAALRALEKSTVREQILAVCPLVERGVSREVIIPITADWSAYFGNWWRGTDLSSVIPVLSHRLACLGLAVTCVPDVTRAPHKRYGARIVEVYCASNSSTRSIWVSNDGGRWVSGATGDPLAEEDPSWMTPRSPKDRFTEGDLRRFVSRFVATAFDTDAWMGQPSFCVESRAPGPSATEHELSEVQQGVPVQLAPTSSPRSRPGGRHG